jgi:AcrR family transcriptional regulator
LARTVNAELHATRRDAFLDAAQRLIQAKGYEQMSIQDILDELDVSRGAFYHYFGSKVALLEAVMERIVSAGLAAVTPIVDDPLLPAAAKLGSLFLNITNWKTERRDLILALIRVWYSDDNAIVREKLRPYTVARFGPPLTTIIAQGRAEGVFDVRSPEDSARVLLSLIHGAQDLGVELFFAREAGTVTFETVQARLGVYTDAYERVLGAQPGSLQIVDDSVLRQWFG